MLSAISGTRTLHRLLYASRQSFSAGMIPREEIDALIHASVRNNQAAEISGLLLVHDGWFVQALEGPAGEVMNTYRRIVDDPRHTDAQVIAAGPAPRREFANWNMCARRFSRADDAILDTLKQRKDFDPSRLSESAALRLLTAVRGVQRRTGG